MVREAKDAHTVLNTSLLMSSAHVFPHVQADQEIPIEYPVI